VIVHPFTQKVNRQMKKEGIGENIEKLGFKMV